MTAHSYLASVEMDDRGWTVTVLNVGHKRHKLVGFGTTRDAAVRDAKIAVARLLGVNTHDVTLTLNGDQ